MTFRLLRTPIRRDLPLPLPRASSFDIALCDAFLTTVDSAPQLEHLREDADALVVTTGQQPGVLLGPAYSLYKGLTAAALAAELEVRWERPVIPVFWCAGDDHDWEEARSAHWRDHEGQLVHGGLAARSASAPASPVGQAELGADWEALLGRFAAQAPPGPHADEMLALLSSTHQPGTRLGRAFAEALARLLGQFGVIVFDSTHIAAKRAMAPWLLHAARDARPLNEAIRCRHAALVDGDHDPGVVPDDEATLLMLEGAEGRDRLLLKGDGFELRRSGEQFSLADIEQIAQTAPSRLSPNVLLRPVVESAILPTVAYCAGPGELRYLALAAALFEQAHVQRPSAFPRWSGVVVEAYVDRMLEKFDLSLDRLLDPSADVLADVMGARMTPATVHALDALRSKLDDVMPVLLDEGALVAEPLVRSAQGSAHRILHELQRLEHRFIRSLKRRHSDELRQLTRARAAVLPANRPQERVLAGADLLARHGRPLLSAVYRDARLVIRSALEGRTVPA